MAPRPRPPQAGPPFIADAETSVLVQNHRDGVAGAAEALFGRHLPSVREIARARLGRSDRARRAMDSEDVMQEALLRAYQGLGRLRVANSAQFVAWMAKIVERTILDVVRAEGREKRGRNRRVLSGSSAAALLRSVSMKGPTPTEVAMGKELAERYFEALETLDDRHRDAILMRRHAGMSFADMAEFFEVGSEAQARVLLSRALTKLSRLLDGDRSR